MQELNETQINTEQLSVKPAVRTSLNPILKIISHQLKKKKQEEWITWQMRQVPKHLS